MLLMLVVVIVVAVVVLIVVVVPAHVTPAIVVVVLVVVSASSAATVVATSPTPAPSSSSSVVLEGLTANIRRRCRLLTVLRLVGGGRLWPLLLRDRYRAIGRDKRRHRSANSEHIWGFVRFFFLLSMFLRCFDFSSFLFWFLFMFLCTMWGQGNIFLFPNKTRRKMGYQATVECQGTSASFRLDFFFIQRYTDVAGSHFPLVNLVVGFLFAEKCSNMLLDGSEAEEVNKTPSSRQSLPKKTPFYIHMLVMLGHFMPCACLPARPAFPFLLNIKTVRRAKRRTAPHGRAQEK